MEPGVIGFVKRNLMHVCNFLTLKKISAEYLDTSEVIYKLDEYRIPCHNSGHIIH